MNDLTPCVKGSGPLIRFGRLSTAAATTTWLLILLGGAVCFTGSAKAIPDWPTSFGRIVPPANIGAVIEYIHRILAVAAGALIAATAVVGLVRYRRDPWLFLPSVLAVVFLVPVVILGMLAVISSITPAQALLDLGCALMVLALTVTTTVSACVRQGRQGVFGTSFHTTRLPVLALGACVGVSVALTLTVAVGPAGAPSSCLGWPAWFKAASFIRSYGTLAIVQYAATAAATVFFVAVLFSAWRSWRTDTAVLGTATVATVLFFCGVLTTELAAADGFPMLLVALRLVFASAAWAALVALFLLSLRVPVTSSRSQPALGRRLLDLVRLTRPTVVLLLLAAALAGSFVGSRGIPPLGTVGWTILGLALATGGAQALNQYLERASDGRMERTSGRPLPSGRLAPAEGLAWGLGLCLAALGIMVDLVGWLAAVLTLAGICWYLFLYTMALKRRTSQSIVFGGVAGGLLPLIGCVAATGRVNVASLLLCVSIFFWTPPHFWSYALLHLQDYSNAGVPAAPLVWGARRARTAILASAAVLVLATFLPILFRSAGLVFLCAAMVLGCVLLVTAGIAWRSTSLESARRLYRVLSFYLGLLLIASAVDALL